MTYKIDIKVNDIEINNVIIDSLVRKKHPDIDDQVVLALVQSLDGETHVPVSKKAPYSYFVKEGIFLGNKKYRLVWLLEENEIYVGVVNAFRRD